jgi:hypothetical protein
MKKIALLTALFLTGFSAFAQDQASYSKLINEAGRLYDQKEYLRSGQKYSEAFAALGNRGMMNDRYNAACSWALANVRDSAFANLMKIAKSGQYTSYNHLVSDPDLNGLHMDPRWTEVVALVKAAKDKAEEGLDKPLVAMLDTIHREDQQYRLQIAEIEKKHGRESAEMKAHWRLIGEKDSINLIKVKKILDERGWLGTDVVGQEGNQTLFLVIQHADITTQQKYLPLMRTAVANGKASASHLALLEDRVALGLGKRQIYGSQISRDNQTGEYFVQPLEDPENVDKRRKEVGLGPLQDYISNWGMKWDVEAYKKKLPALEAKHKKEQ